MVLMVWLDLEEVKVQSAVLLHSSLQQQLLGGASCCAPNGPLIIPRDEPTRRPGGGARSLLQSRYCCLASDCSTNTSSSPRLLDTSSGDELRGQRPADSARRPSAAIIILTQELHAEVLQLFPRRRDSPVTRQPRLRCPALASSQFTTAALPAPFKVKGL